MSGGARGEAPKLIFSAYENEIAIDKRSVELGIADAEVFEKYKLPYFKPLKLCAFPPGKLAIFSRFQGLVSLLIPFVYIHSFVCLVFASIFIKKTESHKKDFYITDCEMSLKSFTALDDFDPDSNFIFFKSYKSIGSELLLKDFLSLFAIVFSVRNMLGGVSDKRLKSSLLFHMYDLVLLAAFYLVILKKDKPKNRLYFDQHVQRWPFLISHAVKKGSSRLVQHGFFDGDINFGNKFSRIDHLYLLADDFLKEFSKVYSYNKVSFVKANLPIKPFFSKKEGEKLIFLASSMPFYAIELEVILKLLSLEKVHILLKLHPRFNYAEKFEVLRDNPRVIFLRGVDYPECDLLVCYNSFLGFEYKSLGMDVLFMDNMDGSCAIYKKVKDLLVI